MYFTLSPFFYFVTHQKDIETYVTIESGGENPNIMKYRKLKQLVDKYIEKNHQGIEYGKHELYSMYVCDKLMK